MLARGYAVCWNEERTAIIREASAVAPGDRVRVTLHEGELDCEVAAVALMDPTIKDFESASAELEAIVKKMEEGDLRSRRRWSSTSAACSCRASATPSSRRPSAALEILNERGELRPAHAAMGLTPADESGKGR